MIINLCTCQTTMYRTWILKINRSSFIFWPLVIFQTENKTMSQQFHDKNRQLWQFPHLISFRPGDPGLWPIYWSINRLPNTCTGNVYVQFEIEILKPNKLKLCSGNHIIHRRTDKQLSGQRDKVILVYLQPWPNYFFEWGCYTNVFLPV